MTFGLALGLGYHNGGLTTSPPPPVAVGLQDEDSTHLVDEDATHLPDES